MSTTQTGQDRLGLQARQIVSNDDLDLIRTNGEAVHRARVAAEYPVAGTLGAAQVTFTEGLDAGCRTISMATPATANGIASAEIVRLAVASGAGKTTSVPYVRTGGVTYHIGAKHAEIPSQNAKALGGSAFAFARWQKVVGVNGAPDGVDDSVPGSLLFDLTTIVGGAWPNHATLNRAVTIWKVNPATSGAASVWTGTCLSDGVNPIATVPHLFGQHQSAVSTTPADYLVVVHGLAVSTTDLSAETDADGNPEYWYLGSVNNGTFDLTGQTILSPPGTNALDLNQLAADLYDTPSLDGDGAANLTAPLEAVARFTGYRINRALELAENGPCGYFGDVAAAKAWIDALSQTPSGGVIAFGLGAWPTNGWAIVAESSNSALYVAGSWKTGGDSVDFATASAAGDYVVALRAAWTSTAPGSESVKAELITYPIADAGNHTLHLVIATFHWDGAVVSALAITDLARTYRPGLERAADQMFKDSTGNVGLWSIADNAGSPEVRLRVFDASDPVDPAGDATGTTILFTRPDSATRRMDVCGPDGEGQPIGVGNAIERDFGTEWREKVTETAAAWYTPGGAVKGYLSKSEGNQSAADGDGDKPAYRSGDFRLLTATDLEVDIPMDHQNTLGASLGAGFSYLPAGKPFWLYSGAGDGPVLVFERHPHERNRSLKGFRITAWQSGGSATGSDTLTASIQRIDTDSAAGTLNAETLSAACAWTADVHTTPTSKECLLQTPAAGTTTDRWVLKLLVGNGSASGEDWYVSKVSAIYKREGLLPS